LFSILQVWLQLNAARLTLQEGARASVEINNALEKFRYRVCQLSHQKSFYGRVN
jgi:hypothetical protein